MLMHRKLSTRHSGFTLVEIAIVLVIIGLLLGGVLKGQALVDSAKVKALQGEFQSVQTMYNAYVDKFKAVPGDDADVANHLPTGATVSTVNAGNGLIDNVDWTGAATPVATNKSSLFWQHVRLAELATGAYTSGQAKNAVGGYLGITSNSNTLHPTTPTTTSGLHVICSSAIPGKLARQLDIAMDDGIPNTGSVYSSAQTGAGLANSVKVATALATSYVDTANYTVCQSF